MKIEAQDEFGRAVVIDIEPNAEGEPEHMHVVIGHDQDVGGRERKIYEGSPPC